jgi:hypothetical protein
MKTGSALPVNLFLEPKSTKADSLVKLSCTKQGETLIFGTY